MDLVQMPEGDYCIHVFIEVGTKFKTDDESQLDFNALFNIESCGISEYSSCKENTLTNKDKNVLWGEHFYLDARGMTKDTIEGAILKIKLLDKGTFRDKLVGMFDIDLARIYAKDDHSIHNQWVAMNNPEGENF